MDYIEKIVILKRLDFLINFFRGLPKEFFDNSRAS